MTPPAEATVVLGTLDLGPRSSAWQGASFACGW
jgi:hypothetical protein